MSSELTFYANGCKTEDQYLKIGRKLYLNEILKIYCSCEMTLIVHVNILCFVCRKHDFVLQKENDLRIKDKYLV